MFSKKEQQLLGISRALLNLHGFFIVDNLLNIIDDPILIFNLLTKVELESFKSLTELEPTERLALETSLVENSVLAIVGSENTISLDFCPAGIISSIAEAVIIKSEEYLLNENNLMYEEAEAGVNYIEKMAAIIAYYMNVNYDFVISLPINEVYKRYSICQQAFPQQIERMTV